ncbi:MAG: type II toxin-antitoxin system RelE/ParE family toxin [Lysobacterales bacterium]
MAEIIWAEPALSDLDAIADYIALENAPAARRLVSRIFAHVEQLRSFPKSGSVPNDLKDLGYRQIVEPPCRIFYRIENGQVYVVHVIRSERKLRRSVLRRR